MNNLATEGLSLISVILLIQNVEDDHWSPGLGVGCSVGVSESRRE